MTFTYRPGSTAVLDRIRVRLGDVDPNASQDLRLEDEEIKDFLATEGDWMRAAAAAADALAAKFARRAEGSQGPGLAPADRAGHLRRLAALFRATAGASAIPARAGDAHDSEKRAFRRGMLDISISSSQAR